MLTEFLILFVIMLILISISPSFKLMNYLTILNAFFYLIFILYVIIYNAIPDPILFSGYILLDNLSLYGILLISIIFFLASLYAEGYVEHLVETGDLHRENLKIFYVAFNLLIDFTILTFSSNNLGLFIVFAEITTFLTAVLIISLNVKENIDAALKYIFVTSVAMIFTFIGLIFLLAIAKSNGYNTLNWSDLVIAAPKLTGPLVVLSFIFMFFGFMSKSGIAPLHTWLPHTYNSAPSVVASILSSAVAYIGLFGILRTYAIAHQTAYWSTLSPVLLFFGLLSMFVGSFSLIHQRNLKKLIAFSSSEQMGFMLVAISIGSHLVIYWLLFYMFIHAMIKALLFFSAGILHRQYRSNEVDTMFNSIQLQPLATIGLLIGSVAILGIPPFGMFLPKFMILFQILAQSQVLILMPVLFFFVIAVAGFSSFDTKLISNMLVHEFDNIKKYETPKFMQVPIIILCIFILIIGIFIPIEIQNYISSIVSLLKV